MDKLEYVRKVFAQTHGKTLENYVITQIWAGVKHLSICPVTQQYVRRPTGGYALLDLYFPQIEFAVEVDEKAHEKNIEHDAMRADDIFRAIQGDYSKSIVIHRIKESSYEHVERDIQEAIAAITERAKQCAPLVWEEDWLQKEYEETFAAIKQRGFLDIADSIGFKRVQVTNDIFGMNKSEGFLQFGKSWFRLGDREALWFPHLTPNKRWANSIDQAWTIIREKRIDGEEALLSPQHHDEHILRYTFARYKGALGAISYRYIGNFRYHKRDNDIFYYVRDAENNRIEFNTAN